MSERWEEAVERHIRAVVDRDVAALIRDDSAETRTAVSSMIDEQVELVEGPGIRNPRVAGDNLIVDLTLNGQITQAGYVVGDVRGLGGPMPTIEWSFETGPAGSDVSHTVTTIDGGYAVTVTVPRGDTGPATLAIDDTVTTTTQTWSSAKVSTELDGKSPASHTHAIGNVNGLQAAIDAKAASEHTHQVGDVTGLQASLDGKAPSAHTHAAADITSGVVAAARLPSGSTGQSGIVQLASSAQTTPGLLSTVAVTPAGLAAFEAAKRPDRPNAVFVGSSNVAGGSAGMWPAKVASALGLTARNFAIGGSSYTTGNGFKSQLQSAAADSSFTNASVSYVFIGDASNNARVNSVLNYTTIYNAALDAFNYARVTWPQARIVVLPMIWPADTAKYAPAAIGGYDARWNGNVLIACAAQRDAALAARCEFLEDSWTWLTGKAGVMIADGDVHPNDTGNTVIANWTLKGIRGEPTTPRTPWATIPPASSYYQTSGHPDGSRDLSWRMEGGTVIVHGSIRPTGSYGTNSDMGVLPELVRVSHAQDIMASTSAGVTSATIHANGNVRIAAGAGSALQVWVSGRVEIF